MADDTGTSGTTTTGAMAGGAGLGLRPGCDVCGREIAPEDLHTEELTVNGPMCPSPMNLHRACYEAASSMWYADPDSYCNVDPLFPETAQWNEMQRQADQAPRDT